MASMGSAEQKFLNCEDIPLARVYAIRNSKYQRDGMKSYVHALLKYNITPTKDGPYFVDDHVHREGKIGIGNFHVPVGEKKITPNVLLKKEQHRHALSHATGSRVGEVDAKDVQHDMEYLCPVILGTPGKTALLDFDTGSADLWCWSTDLPQKLLHAHGRDHSVYNPSKSSTADPQEGFTWKIQYGDGSSASGGVCNDTVTIGGLKVEDQAVEMAKTLSYSFEENPADGLLGLAFSSINTVKPQPADTVVDNMIKQEDIPADAKLFTAWLGSYKDSHDHDHGRSFYTFGFIDHDALESTGVKDPHDIWYTSVDSSKGFWQFPSTTAMVNGHRITLPGNTAIADTGTTLALLSDEVCANIYQHIPGAKYEPQVQGYVFPKHTSARDLPLVQVDVGGRMFTIHKDDLAFTDARHGMVYGGIQSRGTLPFDILGDTFLKAVYAIFDVGNKKFGATQRVEGRRRADS